MLFLKGFFFVILVSRLHVRDLNGVIPSNEHQETKYRWVYDRLWLV